MFGSSEPDPLLKPKPFLVMMAVFSIPVPELPPFTLANFTPSAPTWICSFVVGLLTVKPPLFRVLLPMVRPLSWLSPKVTIPLALSVLTSRPFSPLSFRVLTCSPFGLLSLPTVMVLASSSSAPFSSTFLTLKVCRAVPAIFLASLAAISALSALSLAFVASLADVAACSLAFSAAVLASLASVLAVSAAWAD
ncbi:hypothetical protein AO375_1897 [Moraxella catarrhalis]|nr:hypothetical protein AO375_1897 [Moraxella catarrhalis]